MPKIPDGHHAIDCSICGRSTWRSKGVCKRCESEAKLDPGRMSEAMLILCATELRRRHLEREKALRKLGMLPQD